MAETSSIEWTDATWNPITGCTVLTPGCTNCYAMKLAGTRLQHHPSREGLTVATKAGPVWNGRVRFNEGWLEQPLRWRRPRRIFVCAHGDLFHESVPDEWIDQIFAVMSLAQHHTFQVLTKRAERMREYVAARPQAIWDRRALEIDPGSLERLRALPWPLPNVWLGVSVEDQPRANERIPHLLATPAAVRYLSAEPLLGRVDICEHLGIWWNQSTGDWERARPSGIHWVIAGGESGRGARPMEAAWARSLRDQCAGAGVPFFFKQWGNHKPTSDASGEYMTRSSKAEAGRILDGCTHDGMPA